MWSLCKLGEKSSFAMDPTSKNIPCSSPTARQLPHCRCFKIEFLNPPKNGPRQHFPMLYRLYPSQHHTVQTENRISIPALNNMQIIDSLISFLLLSHSTHSIPVLLRSLPLSFLLHPQLLFVFGT